MVDGTRSSLGGLSDPPRALCAWSSSHCSNGCLSVTISSFRTLVSLFRYSSSTSVDLFCLPRWNPLECSVISIDWFSSSISLCNMSVGFVQLFLRRFFLFRFSRRPILFRVGSENSYSVDHVISWIGFRIVYKFNIVCTGFSFQLWTMTTDRFRGKTQLGWPPPTDLGGKHPGRQTAAAPSDASSVGCTKEIDKIKKARNQFGRSAGRSFRIDSFSGRIRFRTGSISPVKDR